MRTRRELRPFSKYVPDASPIQVRVLQDYIARFRAVSTRILDELGVAREPPRVGARWSFHTMLVAARVTLDEMDARYLRGYGGLSEEDETAVRRAILELKDLVRKMAAVVDEPPGEDLEARLRRLEATGDELRLLQELGRVVSAHGLVELRPALSLLLERIESKSFDVAVFGRVSSGKSSLLNHLLATDVLPVGVTPVTAVPIRVAYGGDPRLRVDFANRTPLEADVSRLAEFASEEQNPGNARLVTDLRVELPAAPLKNGITLVDTPGLGSLATAGAQETRAYLPRSDIGIVLVDAASALDREDLDLIRTLYRSGTRVMVLASKIDLLASSDRERVMHYIERNLATELAVQIPVHSVSVVGESASLAAAWFEGQLLPIFAARELEAERSVRRKIGALREAALSALRSRLDFLRGRDPASGRDRARAESLLQAVAQRIAGARKDCFDVVSVLEVDEAAILEEATDAMVQELRDPSSSNAAGVLGAILGRRRSEAAARLVRYLSELCRELEGPLKEAARLSGLDENELPGFSPPRDVPRPDAFPVAIPFELPAARGLAALGPILRGRVRPRLSSIAPRLRESLRAYRKEMLRYSERMLKEYREVVDAIADLCRAALGSSSVDESGTADDEAAIEQDLDRLAKEPAPIEDKRAAVSGSRS